MNNTTKNIFTASTFLLCIGNASANDIGTLAGEPVCLEGNYMVADAQNTPFASANGPGRVLDTDIFYGDAGVFENPFTPENVGTPLCDNGSAVCDLGVPGPYGDGSAPWKPTGVMSGGQNGHAFFASAAQHQITEFHRSHTALRTIPTLPTHPGPGTPFGSVPRLLGSGFMPNGNFIQTVCDANFFNAPNSDSVSPDGNTHVSGNASNLFFPAVYSTPERGANGRLLVLDGDTMEAIDEYSIPKNGDPRWNCPAGISFTSEGMLVSMFHGGAVFVIDWKAGTQSTSAGVGSNDPGTFKLDRKSNQAKVIRVIDLLNEDMNNDGVQDAADAALDDPNRRDSLRAHSLDEAGNVYGTFRARSQACEEGEAGCNPGVFRHHVFIAKAGENFKTGTIAMDPGVNIIAGLRINRVSAKGCEVIKQQKLDTGAELNDQECEGETLYVATSAGNAGCDPDNDGNMGPGHPANQCFVPGGTVYEYRIDAAYIDGGNGGTCTGNPADGYGPGEGNHGCASPISQFEFADHHVPGSPIEKLDPRMLMNIHGAFVQ